MSINRNIMEQLTHLAKGVSVKDVRIGLGYTAVQLENGQTGVAFTFHEGMTRGYAIFKGLHPLSERDALELLALLDSTDKIEMAVALATANALSNTIQEDLREGDIMEYLNIAPDDMVGMVGYFAPMIPRLKKKTSSIMIFEKIKKREGDLLPEEDAIRLLPQCQVAIITSTSILNNTIDNILNAARLCREVVLLGASTPLIPDAFAGTAVTFLSGIIITRPQEMLRIVSEGGGVRSFKNNVRKVNLSLKN